MRKPLLALASALALFVALSLSAAASGATFGPFSGGSPDSGTCGNNWANDTYKWSMSVTPLNQDKVTLTETFTDGRFTTLAGKSPGACNTGDNGSTVVAGVKGSFSGSESGDLTNAVEPTGTPDLSKCQPPQEDGFSFTACRVKAIFGADAVFTPTTFKFNYTADCGQSLIGKAWQNADSGSGGNIGDISSAKTDVDPTVTPCPTPTPTASPTATPHPSPTVVPVLAQTGSGAGEDGFIMTMGLLIVVGIALVGIGVFTLVRGKP